MNRLYVPIICFLALFFAPLHVAKSADRSYMSLITCSPGSEVYAFFGHTALRYYNPDKNADLVFNYGVFDFSEPNFVAKFVLGETDYMLGLVEYKYFIQEYAMRGSGVIEQVLALDSLQQQKLLNLLLENYRSKNRIYRYNYFYNNCTTKARDIIEEALADAGSVEYSPCDRKETFRETIHRFTAVSPWYSFGIDLLLGCEADVAPGARVMQFIPSTLMRDFSIATVSSSNESVKPLVKQTNTLLEPVDNDENSAAFFTPNIVFALLLLIIAAMTYAEYRKRKLFWPVDAVLLFVQGVAGLLITFMVLFSVHPTVGSNLLVLLFNPLPLVLLPIYIYNIIKSRKQNIMWMQAIMVAQFLVLSPFIPQYIPVAIYMFAVTLLIRSLYITHIRK